MSPEILEFVIEQIVLEFPKDEFPSFLIAYLPPTPQIPGGGMTTGSQRNPIPAGSFTLNLSANVVAALPTVPANATGASLYLERGDFDQVRMKADGTNPTANEGVLLKNSATDQGYLELFWGSKTALEQVRFLLVTDPNNDGAIIQGQFFNTV